MAEKKQNQFDFEKGLEESEQIVFNLEKGEVKLDEALKLFEQGVAISRKCEKKLSQAERKIEILQKGTGGEKKVRKKKVKVKEETGEIDDKEDLQGSLL